MAKPSDAAPGRFFSEARVKAKSRRVETVRKGVSASGPPTKMRSASLASSQVRRVPCLGYKAFCKDVRKRVIWKTPQTSPLEGRRKSTSLVESCTLMLE